jgi:hypothetical protein
MRTRRFKRLQPAFKSSLRYLIPGILFYYVLGMFFKSFNFSALSILMLLALGATCTYFVSQRKLLATIPGILFAAGSITFLLSIGQNSLQRYFILGVSILFMIMMVGVSHFFNPEKRRREEKLRLLDSGFNLNQAIIMFAVFFLASGIYGVYIITHMLAAEMMLFIFLGTYLAAYYLIGINYLKSQELELHLDYYKNRTFGFYSFLPSLLMVELVWAMTYLPINHLTFGALVLIIFFSYWNIIRKHLRSELTKKVLVENFIFILLTTTAIIMTSRLYIN